MLHVFIVKLDGRSSWHQNNILNSHDIIYVLYIFEYFLCCYCFYTFMLRLCCVTLCNMHFLEAGHKCVLFEVDAIIIIVVHR